MQWTDFVSGDFRDAFDAKIEVRSNMFARDNMFLTLDERKLSSVYFSRRDIATPSRPYSKSERCDIYHKIVEQNSVRYSAKTRIHVVCWTFSPTCTTLVKTSKYKRNNKTVWMNDHTIYTRCEKPNKTIRIVCQTTCFTTTSVVQWGSARLERKSAGAFDMQI